MEKHLFTCAPGVERFLVRELERSGLNVAGKEFASATAPCPSDFFQSFSLKSGLCFARSVLESPREYQAGTIADITRNCCDFFCASIKEERVANPWPLYVDAIGENPVADEHRGAIADELLARLKKVVSRVAKLGQPLPTLPCGIHRGLFILLTDRNRLFVSRQCWSGGQRRMKMAAGAPSRSYLKIEEAYGIFGRSPVEGETVVDLGAAPGGWSFSAASRGAQVTAVDNGPLDDGALENPRIRHVREDAFAYGPQERPDWLFCDMVEEPERVITLVRKWLHKKMCRAFIVNLKFGRSDPIALLDRVDSRENGFASLCDRIDIRHLYHDREEMTVMGVAKGA